MRLCCIFRVKTLECCCVPRRKHGPDHCVWNSAIVLHFRSRPLLWARSACRFTAGVARTTITPYWGVELTGWGYYIERCWQRIHDDLHATAVAVDDGRHAAVIVALDLMVIDDRFTSATRERINAATGIPPDAVLLTCSHSSQCSGRRRAARRGRV